MSAMTAVCFHNCTLLVRHEVVTRDTFFAHENQPSPPSLSNNGNLRFGSKANLLTGLENLVTTSQECTNADTIVLDGAVVVQMFNPRHCRTFDDYATEVFIPYIVSS